MDYMEDTAQCWVQHRGEGAGRKTGEEASPRCGSKPREGSEAEAGRVQGSLLCGEVMESCLNEGMESKAVFGSKESAREGGCVSEAVSLRRRPWKDGNKRAFSFIGRLSRWRESGWAAATCEDGRKLWLWGMKCREGVSYSVSGSGCDVGEEERSLGGGEEWWAASREAVWEERLRGG